MLRNLVLASALVGLGASATAQCATLTATNTNNVVTIDLDGSAPMAFAWFVVGETTGTTPVTLGSLASFQLGLTLPFVAVPAGLTDLSGDASLSFTAPASAPLTTLYAQGVTFSLTLPQPPFGGPPSITLDVCTSDVASFQIGS